MYLNIERYQKVNIWFILHNSPPGLHWQHLVKVDLQLVALAFSRVFLTDGWEKNPFAL